MDKLQSMSVFVQIAERGSLTAAADALGKSLPSVVRILATLEESLQVRLFNRTTRRIALTEEGRFYLERCRKILADIEETDMALGEHQIEPSGTVSLTAPVRFGEMHVAPAVTRFLQRHRRMRANLLLLDRVVNLLEEGMDAAVRIAELSDSSLIARPIGEIRRVVCASPTLLSETGRPQRPEALSALPCLLFTGISTGSAWHFQDGDKRLSVPVSGRLLCNQVGAAIDACIAGLGFGLFLHYQAMPSLERGTLEIVLSEFEPPPLPVSVVYPHTRLMSARVRTFVDWPSGAPCALLPPQLFAPRDDRRP
jgi:DNA-binding transcriptional LysR family regulator